jgi:hypothetical protein
LLKLLKYEEAFAASARMGAFALSSQERARLARRARRYKRLLNVKHRKIRKRFGPKRRERPAIFPARPTSAEAGGLGAFKLEDGNCRAVWSEATERDEKAVRQLDGLLFQGRIVPTEVQKTIRTFWKKSYGRLKGSVKEFFDNKRLCFQ